MQSRSLFLVLIISALLSLVAIAIIPIYHQANAKECNDNNNDDSSCSDKQSSDSNSNDDDHNNKHSDDGGNSAKKDKTPFVLAQPIPFP
jgi:cytoskeletal protein RodZ